MPSTSFKEIGRKLNISRFTVARVLRGDKYVSEKTRARVLDHLKKEPYVPNVHSAALSSGRVNVIGLVFIGDALFSMEFYIQQIIIGVSEAVKREGYQLMLFTQESFNGADCLNLFLSKRVAGFILPAVGRGDFAGVLGLKKKKVPLALLCSRLEGVPSFDCDNVAGGYMAAKYLLGSGRRRVAFIHANENWVDAEDRYKGYKKALKEAGKEITESNVQYNTDGDYAGYEKKAVGKLLSQGKRPDAIFAVNDRMALAAMAAVRESGRDVPRDIAVMGFDDIPGCESCYPPLTTVAQPVREMAVAAAEALIREISSGKSRARTELFKPEIIVRRSA